MSTQTTFILDLHNADGRTGYRLEWDYRTRALDAHMCEDGELIFCGHFATVDDREIEYMLGTAYSVATAVRDDLTDGCIREAFSDGLASLDVEGLLMDFELADESSNDVVRCWLSAECPETGEFIQAVKFDVALTDLEAAVAPLEALIFYQHRQESAFWENRP